MSRAYVTMLRRLPALLLLLTPLTFVPLLAGGEETPSAYFAIKRGPAELFPLLSTDVFVSIDGVIAEVVVRQTYANDGAEPIHARYVFPGSTSASVHGMRIRVGDQAVVATIREKGQARREFETAKQEGKSASLLEQHRPNVFGMDVANIMPGDRVEVELTYSELLIPEEGTYGFVFPTVVAPRYDDGREPAPVPQRWLRSPFAPARQDAGGAAGPAAAASAFSIQVSLATGLPLQEVVSPSHEIVVDWSAQDRARVSLARPDEPGNDRDFILSYRLAGHEIESGLLLQQGETENFFLLMVQPPERVEAADIPPREYLFVLDVSGSMGGFPIETGKALLAELIAGLREVDRFNVLLFAGGSRLLAEASVPASPGNAASAMALIDQEQAGGGTELEPALRRALSLPRDEAASRTIVVITDGLVSAERSTFELVAANLNRANLFCFGIGSSVNRFLLEGLARAGQGTPFVVTDASAAPQAAARFRRYVAAPVLTDLLVSFDGFEAYDIEPPVLPDLFAERPIVLQGKWRGPLRGSIEITGRQSGGPWGRTFSPADLPPAPAQGISRLWARTRIARLDDWACGREEADLAAQVRALGLTYSLLTRYTSFIAVLEQVRNADGFGHEVDQPVALARGLSEGAIGGTFAMGTEPELWILLLVAGIVVPVVLMRRAAIS